MKMRITSRHDKLSPKIKDYIDEKLSKLDRFYDRIIDCEVIVDNEKLKHVIEMNIKVYSTVLNVTTKDSDITKAIDLCVDKLEIQLKKFKEKMKKKSHKKVSEIIVEADSLTTE
jgi:putative sigma-54 modulation protein